jgi:pentatricopeptide repeat protein
MSTARLALDPLWQCLCPAWSQATSALALRTTIRRTAPARRCLKERRGIAIPGGQRRGLAAQAQVLHQEKEAGSEKGDVEYATFGNTQETGRGKEKRAKELDRLALFKLLNEPTPYIYTKLRIFASQGKVGPVRALVEYLVHERGEKPDVSLYTSLILSNINTAEGAAWRVLEYIEEMRQAGLEMNRECCHAVLKVLAVHPDHLLRADVLEYMKSRWHELTPEGAHDVAAGMLREGSFEQAIARMDSMARQGVQVQGWLLDMAVYCLCAAGEIEEAHRIMLQRHHRGELNISRTLWHTVLDTASSYRHHPATSLVWNSQVNTGYLNPSSGICLAVLTTASKAGDAVLATEVFDRLSKRGTLFQPIHYNLLIDTYLNGSSGPDLKRALSILTIMALEKLEPSVDETRGLYAHIHSGPKLVEQAFSILIALRDQGRRIPVSALNLIIECYVEQRNLPEALKIYKLMHTFIPPGEGAKQRTLANIETFNLLLKGCRLAQPPDEAQACFLVSELLALRIKPTPLTYDRLILVFVEASTHALNQQPTPDREKGLELLDWAFRHFSDMRAISTQPSLSEPASFTGWMPRFGTIERLSILLAKVGDKRCWDVLQTAEDVGEEGLEGWEAKGKWTRSNVEKAWAEAVGEGPLSAGDVAEWEGDGGGDVRREGIGAAG